MASGYVRGHLVEYDWNKEKWLFADNGDVVDDSMSCKKCGKMPTNEGYDHCLGKLEGVKHACCGHGVEEGYVIYA
jgi:hypothetical protein